MCQEIDSVTVSNIYIVKILNKTNASKHITFKLMDLQYGILQFTSDISMLEEDKTTQSVLMIKLPKQKLNGRSTDLKIGIFEANALISTTTINFIGPQN